MKETKPSLNLFATVLTHEAPSSNYRGESEMNRTIIQKIHRRGQDYAVVSPEAIRNALREILAGAGLPMNRSRLHQEDQLAVEFKGFPNAAKYADDFLFGFMVADKDAIAKNKSLPAKRDSVLRLNLAVALTPYRFDATFHQSPLNAGQSTWKNADSSALIHREVTFTSYQFPFALALGDCETGDGPAWTRALLGAFAQLSNVAGGHARSYYEMAPRSIVLRLTPSLVAGFDTYGFTEDGRFAELPRINSQDLPGSEFRLGGELVRRMDAAERARLEGLGVRLFESPQALLAAVAAEAFPG
ncbi:type I-B CRISPR-associated protein Cas7/Cst2/DevR [Acidobacteria bacterium ACD]|nr:MAG: type I-B CRISPR-associated protein Cas7/Cst2/DevR [Acidobacteriota bacterium]MCE7958220.1 type I-B CRISPR-associated protein Cas7/Cst2/DevR [Acidobacteria bacterium ACB2]MDL1948789.1 type I-B CRISPR-associated protein Cas7/Cst2/DevR [Acidobacteria bacterium ACD]